MDGTRTKTWVLTSFTITPNRRQDSSGHVFQGRFAAHLVEDQAYGGEVSRCIHLNPVRTKALRAASVAVRREAWSQIERRLKALR